MSKKLSNYVDKINHASENFLSNEPVFEKWVKSFLMVLDAL
jgi:hypothetical protein